MHTRHGRLRKSPHIAEANYSTATASPDESEPVESGDDSSCSRIVVNGKPAFAVPNEVLHDILGQLSLRDLIAAGQVNQRWRSASLSQILWSRFEVSLYPDGVLSDVDNLYMSYSASNQVPLDNHNTPVFQMLRSPFHFTSRPLLRVTDSFLSVFSARLSHIRRLHCLPADPSLEMDHDPMPAPRELTEFSVDDSHQSHVSMRDNSFLLQLQRNYTPMTAQSQHLHRLLSHTPSLKFLHLTHHPSLPASLFASLPSTLVHLDLSHSNSFTSLTEALGGGATRADSLPSSLISLDLHASPLVTTGTLQWLLALKVWENLDVSRCPWTALPMGRYVHGNKSPQHQQHQQQQQQYLQHRDNNSHHSHQHSRQIIPTILYMPTKFVMHGCDVLPEALHTYAQAAAEGNRTVELDVRDSVEITGEDVEEAIQTGCGYLKVKANPKLRNHSAQGVREYLNYLIGM